MNNMPANFHGIMATFILTALILSSCGQIEQETTIYFASCRGEMKGQACNGVIIPEARMSFKVLVSRQEVLFWFDDSGMVDKLNSCVVRDKDSWNCSYGKQMWIMENGNFRKYPPEPDERWFVISKYKWWPAYIWEWVKDLTTKKKTAFINGGTLANYDTLLPEEAGVFVR